MSKILLGETLRGERAELDLQELITGRTLLCSISRFGKTWTARRIVEQVFGKTGIIIVDVEGEYSTLRDRFPLLIVGKDVPLVPESAEFLSDQVLEHDLSCIIDGSDPQLDIAAFQEFLARFVDRFIAMETKMRKPYLWILEEADELAPETGIARSICLGQIRKLVKKGGKRGLGTMVLTQRPAFVSKFVISQCPNKLIGRTEWPDDLAVLRKFGRIPEKYADPESKDPHALKNLEKGQFYVAGDFIAKDTLAKVGPVLTKHLGATPEIVPPAPKELKEVLAQLSEKLPAIIQEKLAPAVPKVAEIEARLRETFEGQWQARLARKEKELSSIKNRLEAKYETELADLRRKLDDAVRQTAMKGPVSDLLSHPLVKKNLEKLNAKQRSLVELFETRGPQDTERLSLFLEVSPKRVPTFVYDINRKIPKLIENVRGQYVSRLAKLFPVTEEAKAEAKQVEALRSELSKTQGNLLALTALAERYRKERDELAEKLKIAEGREPRAVAEAVPPTPHKATEGVSEERPAEPEVPVEVTLRRKLTSFEVTVSKEVLDVDESSPTGKLLARGIKGFFDEAKGFGAVMGELERVYGLSRTSGGTRQSVQDALVDLCAKGILERKSEANQWMYLATPDFKERIRKT